MVALNLNNIFYFAGGKDKSKGKAVIDSESQLNLILKANRILSQTNNLIKLRKNIISIFNDLLSVKQGALFLSDEVGEMVFSDFINEKIDLPDHEIELIKKTATSNETLILKNVDVSAVKQGIKREHSKIYLPLMHDEKCRGVVFVNQFKDGVALMPGDVEFMSSIGNECALSLSNAFHFKSLNYNIINSP